MTDYWFTRTVDQLTSDPLLKAPSGKTNGKPADDFQKIARARIPFSAFWGACSSGITTAGFCIIAMAARAICGYAGGDPGV